MHVQLFFLVGRLAGWLVVNTMRFIDCCFVVAGRDPQCVIHKLNWTRSTIAYKPFFSFDIVGVFSYNIINTSETHTAVRQNGMRIANATACNSSNCEVSELVVTFLMRAFPKCIVLLALLFNTLTHPKCMNRIRL